MTAPVNPLAETLALLAQFERSAWGQCHVRTGSLEVFLSRTPRFASPMSGAAAEGARVVGAADVQLLAAPHVATLRSISAVGDAIRAGAVYAVVEVLDEARELVADCDGAVIETLARPGDLVEHDQPLIRLQTGRATRT